MAFWSKVRIWLEIHVAAASSELFSPMDFEWCGNWCTMDINVSCMAGGVSCIVLSYLWTFTKEQKLWS